MKNTKEIFKYNTKNAGQQLINLTNSYYNDLDNASKTDILETMRSIGVHLIEQHEIHKDKF